jgi:hypothetical protein
VSGGSYQYAYGKLDAFIDEMNSRPTTPTRKAFAAHLQLVSQAMHDVEWVDSADYGYGDENAAIAKCLGKDGPQRVLEVVIADAQKAIAEIDAAIKAAKKAKTGTKKP